MNQPDRADAFRRMHQPDAGRILVLPNAWDAMSARLIEDAGARAIATTSAGVAWALGRQDGEGLTRDQMINAIERITRVVRVPVTADVERGYGDGGYRISMCSTYPVTGLRVIAPGYATDTAVNEAARERIAVALAA